MNARAIGGNTALHIAAQYGRLNMVRTLIVTGADTNIKNDVGATPMTIALWNGHLDVVNS